MLKGFEYDPLSRERYASFATSKLPIISYVALLVGEEGEQTAVVIWKRGPFGGSQPQGFKWRRKKPNRSI